MHWIMDQSRRFVQSEDGPTATEYAVMLALIIMVAIAGVTLLGTKVNLMFTNADSNIPAGTPGAFGSIT